MKLINKIEKSITDHKGFDYDVLLEIDKRFLVLHNKKFWLFDIEMTYDFLIISEYQFVKKIELYIFIDEQTKEFVVYYKDKFRYFDYGWDYYTLKEIKKNEVKSFLIDLKVKQFERKMKLND